MKILGINGFGTIGKLMLGYFLNTQYYKRIIVNLAPEVTTAIHDIPKVIKNEPFFDSLRNQIQTQDSDIQQDLSIETIPGPDDSFLINDITLTFLRRSGNIGEIGWAEYGVRTVVETTGKYLDPIAALQPSGDSIQGHLDAGAEKIVLASHFRINRSDLLHKGRKHIDWTTMVTGINESEYKPMFHRIISASSPTMVFVAHMIEPLLNMIGPKNLLSVSVTKVCSIEEYYDDLHEARDINADHPRPAMANGNSNSILNVTSIQIEDALRELMPDLEDKGLIAESLGIRNFNGTLIIMVANIANIPYQFTEQSKANKFINDIYQKVAEIDPTEYLRCDDSLYSPESKFPISRPIISIQTQKTHTRTAEIPIDLPQLLGDESDELISIQDFKSRIPVTQAVIYGWIANAKWSYIRTLADNVVIIDKSISK